MNSDKKENFNKKYLLFISMVSAMGGLLFGYDWVVIGGAKPFYEKFFHIMDDAVLQGWAMSSALVGCFLGAALSGILSDRYGRKKLLIFSALLFILSAMGTGASDQFFFFILYRVIGGVGIGLASNLSPMYIAEVSPAKMRGKFVSLNQLTIVIGILLAQIINWQIAQPVPEGSTAVEILNSWNGQMAWRWMFWAESIPAALFFILMIFIPESPRFLAAQNKPEKMFEVLSKIGGPQYAEKTRNEIRSSFTEEQTKKDKVSNLFKKPLRKILIIGLVLAAFQQWCGINVIFNYAEEVFEAAGYGVSDILLNIVITGSVNLIFTFVAIFTVDRLGRKALMMLGAAGLAGIYGLMGLMYFMEFHGLPLLILVVLAIACYAMSLAPVTWVVLSEIFPNRVRAKAMSFATLTLWLASFVLTISFPILNKSLGAYGTFWLYGLISIAGFLFIRKNLPETKGKTLEEIEHEMIK